ncbi:MAG: hypothetical protein AAGE52_29850 [Myxococcota bacterium]
MDALFMFAAMFVAVLVFVALNVLQELLRIRFGKPGADWVQGPDVPPEYWHLFQGAIEIVRAKGFEPFAWIELTSPLDGSWRIAYQPWFRANDGTFAGLELADPLNTPRSVHLVFTSLLASGRSVTTHNYALHLQICLDPNNLHHDAYAATVDDQLAFHRAKIAAAAEIANPSPAEFTDAVHASLENGFQAMISSNQIAERSDGYQLTLLGALRLGWQMVKGGKGKPTPDAFLPSGVFEVPPRLQFEGWLRYDELRQRTSARRTSLWLFAGTALLTLASFAGWFELQTAILVIVVLALHEGGHYAAMLASGYRNVRVFFLPFVGAATTGQPVERTLGKELFVLLAGPLPGAALGFALFFVVGSEFDSLLGEFALLLVGINLLNLLPFFPLDGGRAVHVLVGDLHPVIDIGLKVLAMGAFVFAWVVLDEPLAFVLILAVVATFANKAARAIEQECRQEGRTAPVDVLSRVLAYEGMTGSKARVTMQLVLDRLTSSAPRTRARVAGALVYGTIVLVCFVGPMVFLVAQEVDDDFQAGHATVTCSDPQLPPNRTAFTAIAMMPSESAAEELLRSVQAPFPAHCVLPPWTHPPTQEVMNARRTWAAILEAEWSHEQPIAWADAVAEVRASNEPWLDEVVLDAYTTEPLELDAVMARRFGVEACDAGRLRLHGHADGRELYLRAYAPDEVEAQELVRYLCAETRTELQLVWIE